MLPQEMLHTEPHNCIPCDASISTCDCVVHAGGIGALSKLIGAVSLHMDDSVLHCVRVTQDTNTVVVTSVCLRPG